MSFLTWGLFWGGVAAISSPILIHLLNRQKYKRIRWAAMEFLLLAFKRTRRRMQIEHLIILLLRCLTMLMLGMVLAQPILGGVIVSGSRDVYVLLDDSYSMEYKSGEESTFTRAQTALKKILNDLNPQDDVHVVLLSDVTRSAKIGEKIVPARIYSEGNKLTKHDIDRFISDVSNFKVSNCGTDMYSGLEAMYHMIYQGPNTEQLTKEFYLITDFQRIAWGLGSLKSVGGGGAGSIEAGLASQQKKFHKLLDDFSQPHEGMEAKVVLVDAGEENSDQKKDDFVIDGITVDQKELVTDSTAPFEVKVRNNGFKPGDAKVDFFFDDSKVPWASKTIPTLGPGESQSVTFLRPFGPDAGPHWVTAIVNDRLTTDSTCFLGFNVRKGVNVLVIDGDKQADINDIESETYYLRKALYPVTEDEEREGPAVGEKKLYIAKPIVAMNLPAPKDGYGAYDIVMMANLNITESSPTDEQIQALENYVRNGGKLVIWLGDKVNATDYNQRLYKKGQGIMPAELGEKKGDRYSDTGEMKDKTRLFPGELTHEMMRPFLDSRILERDKESPDFTKYFMLKVAPRDAAVIARFERPNRFTDDMSEMLPALIEKHFPNNGGRVILVNTTADKDWNNMVVSPKDSVYVTLVHQMVLYLMENEQNNVLVGQSIEKIYTLTEAPDEKLLPQLLTVKGPTDDAPKSVPDAKVEKVGDDRWLLRAAVKDTFAAGAYMLHYTSTSGGESKDCFGVNVDLAESDLTRVEPEKLRGVYPEFKVHSVIKPGQPVEVPGINASSNVWRYPLALMVIFLALESGLALLFGKRSSGA